MWCMHIALYWADIWISTICWTTLSFCWTHTVKPFCCPIFFSYSPPFTVEYWPFHFAFLSFWPHTYVDREAPPVPTWFNVDCTLHALQNKLQEGAQSNTASPGPSSRLNADRTAFVTHSDLTGQRKGKSYHSRWLTCSSSQHLQLTDACIQPTYSRTTTTGFGTRKRR